MALISIYGGLRGSELYKMTFKDVNAQKVGEDVSGITITIPQHKTKKKKEDGFTFQLAPLPLHSIPVTSASLTSYLTRTSTSG